MDAKEIKVKLNLILIKDPNSGEELCVQTVRTAQEIAEYIEESEKDELVDKLQTLVSEAYEQLEVKNQPEEAREDW